jgi:hypothetical protein
MSVTIVPHVEDGTGVTQYPSVTEYGSVTGGVVEGGTFTLLLMTGFNLVLMNSNLLGLL